MATVAVEHVSKIFPGEVRAVDDVSILVGDGEFLVLVGPSGCGKSTLLRMIAGLDEPTAVGGRSGVIRIGDRDVTSLAPKDRDVAMVFQNYALYPHMTVRRNMAFGLKLRRVPKATIDERVQAAAEMLGLRDLLDRKPAALSGGQRQRVAVGRAIVRDPAVFLFDEPLSNLDALLRIEMRRELAALHRRLQATMIYVTHDQVEAMTLGDRIVVMKGGVVQQIGPPLEVYDRPANTFVAGFLGSPPMNIVPAQLFGEADNRTRFCGVRPEHLSLAAAADAVNGTVSSVQPLGSETLVEVDVSGERLFVRVESHVLPNVGSETPLSFDPQRLHRFDRDGVRVEPVVDHAASTTGSPPSEIASPSSRET